MYAHLPLRGLLRARSQPLVLHSVPIIQRPI